MTYDEDGEPENAPPCILNLPDLRGDTVVLGAKCHRRENGAQTQRGHQVPLLEMTLTTTEGPLRFFLTRDEASRFANGILECVIDG